MRQYDMAVQTENNSWKEFSKSLDSDFQNIDTNKLNRCVSISEFVAAMNDFAYLNIHSADFLRIT